MGDFRFGVNLTVSASRAEWIDKCRTAEDLGYDVLCVPDHLDLPDPFPSLLLAAEYTERPRLCPYVLNAGFYPPALLARQVSTARALIGNRLELGVGTGYAKEEFDRAGLPWPSPGERIDHLERTLDEFGTDGPRLLVGGWGDRMLTLAARRASIVGFTGTASHREGRLTTLAGLEKFGERVKFVRAALDGREAEFNVLVQRVVLTEHRRSTLKQVASYAPELSVDELGRIPTLLVGTAAQIAEQLVEHREKLGLSYVTVLEPSMDAFASVIEYLS